MVCDWHDKRRDLLCRDVSALPRIGFRPDEPFAFSSACYYHSGPDFDSDSGSGSDLVSEFSFCFDSDSDSGSGPDFCSDSKSGSGSGSGFDFDLGSESDYDSGFSEIRLNLVHHDPLDRLLP